MTLKKHHVEEHAPSMQSSYCACCQLPKLSNSQNRIEGSQKSCLMTPDLHFTKKTGQSHSGFAYAADCVMSWARCEGQSLEWCWNLCLLCPDYRHFAQRCKARTLQSLTQCAVQCPNAAMQQHVLLPFPLAHCVLPMVSVCGVEHVGAQQKRIRHSVR